MASEYCPQCAHCNAHKAVTARLSTWTDALQALKSAQIPHDKDEPAFTVQDVFLLATFLDGVISEGE